jgi:hypothetical protein
MKKAIFSVIGVVAFYYVASMILDFFDVGFSTYMPYLLWLVALVVMYVVLPKTREVFLVNSSSSPTSIQS